MYNKENTYYQLFYKGKVLGESMPKEMAESKLKGLSFVLDGLRLVPVATQAQKAQQLNTRMSSSLKMFSIL